MSQLSLYLDIPVAVFKARVNFAGTVTYPVTTLTFDTVTVGAYTDIEIDQTLWLGTAEGLDDLGRCRVQGTATSTTIPVGRVSEGYEHGQLTVQDNAYITVFANYEVWAKIPYMPDDGTQYKDANIAVGSYTTTEPPVANCGPGFAATIDAVTSKITVSFTGVNSLAIADGATISSYAWDIADGTVSSGSTSAMEVTVTFPAGFRWVALTVTDSNSKTHTARCPILAVDPADDVRIGVFNANADLTPSGQSWDIEIKQDIPQSTYPDGCLVMVWQGEPIAPADRSHMRLIGWHQTDDANTRSSRTGNERSTSLHVVDVAGRLMTLPGFSQEVDKATTPDKWSEMTSPTMFKYLHYLLQWHSTALALADYLPAGRGSDYPFVTFASDGASLFEQVNDLAKKILPDHLVTCNQQGQLKIWPDPMLQDAADRTSTVQGSLHDGLVQEVSFPYARPPKVHWLTGYAFLTQTDYTVIDGQDTLLAVKCRAPGSAPGQGLGEQETTEGVVKSQAVLNSVTGHRFARLNARYGPVTVTRADDSDSTLDAARLDWVQLTLLSGNAAQRGLAFDGVRTLIKAINRRYEARRTGTVQSASYQLEIETVGKPALTMIPDGSTYNPDPPAAVPEPGLISGQDLVAAIGKFKVYRTTDFTTPSGSGGPTWDAKDLTGADEMQTWVVDPFSPGYIAGSGAINGWAATTTKLYRLTDLFGTTPAVTAVVTFAKTASWRTVQASFGTYFIEGSNPWLICVSYYGSTAGHTGTWATYSKDGGATWATEVQISAYYDSGGAVNPIGLYCSPKTPGLAYTAAHQATANPAVAVGYQSTDWGATWTAMAGVADPSKPTPQWASYVSGPGTYTVLGDLGRTVSFEESHSGGTGTRDVYFYLAPPANTKRIAFSGSWFSTFSSPTGFDACGANLDIQDGLSTTLTDTLAHYVGNQYAEVTTNGSFTGECSFPGYASGDFPVNIGNLAGAAGSTNALRFRIYVSTSGSSSVSTSGFTISIDEVELDDGTIYTPATGAIAPVNGMAGQIHLPWQDNASEDVFYSGQLDRTTNRQFALRRSVAGVITDISPNDGSIDYGVNAGAFSVRAHDSDRSKVLAAVTGNDATASASDDKQGVYVSSDGGDTWTQVVAPATGTEVYQAAWTGALDGGVYVWGPAGFMKYSADSGATLDDRSGNLAALSATKLIGIAGGPLP